MTTSAKKDLETIEEALRSIAEGDGIHLFLGFGKTLETISADRVAREIRAIAKKLRDAEDWRIQAMLATRERERHLDLHDRMTGELAAANARINELESEREKK